MAIDAQHVSQPAVQPQVQLPPAGPPAFRALAASDLPPAPVVQSAPDLTGLLVAQLAPIAQQAAQQAVQDVQARMSAVEATVAAQLPALEAKIGVAAAPAVTSILTNVESDPTTQRIVVCATLGAALAGALIILVAALLGNGQAQHWIAAAPALLGAAVLWISKAGVSLPGTSAPKPRN